MWEKLKSMEYFTNKQFQKQNGMNDNLTVLKKTAVCNAIFPLTADLSANNSQCKDTCSYLYQERRNSI